jgi:hypothetical protein
MSDKQNPQISISKIPMGSGLGGALAACGIRVQANRGFFLRRELEATRSGADIVAVFPVARLTFPLPPNTRNQRQVVPTRNLLDVAGGKDARGLEI